MENEIIFSKHVTSAINGALAIAISHRNEFILPEHFLISLLSQEEFRQALILSDAKPDILQSQLFEYVDSIEKTPGNIAANPTPSVLLSRIFDMARQTVVLSDRDFVEVPHVVKCLLATGECFASFCLSEAIREDEGSFISDLVMTYNMIDGSVFDFQNSSGDTESATRRGGSRDADTKEWKMLVTRINDNLNGRNPLVGREPELEKTIRVLCRKDKNNALHIGEPGVGKTALVYGLAKMIEDGNVPEKLKDSSIYMLDLGTLLAGTQFRGDMERRIKLIMDGVQEEKGAIVYIDEIHNLIGAGAVGDSSMDASNMLKPYLESGKIRFIGSTTYDEYKRHFAKSKGIVRRFTQIDIPEPSVEETVNILRQLKRQYEKFHGVHYLDNALEFAVSGAARHINERFLPDKAIDLMDEAGAYRQLHPLDQKRQTVDKALMADILAKMCKVESLAVRDDSLAGLATLGGRISAQIFGQDDAVGKVTEAVLMAKAGLTEENKPVASLLFVGPTGVGKTEVARVLANEMSLELIRFDMSEYAEKHAVAKLIGSPAGYVGYEDGGLLTDAIRKTPNCVLLLDEIEKAHPDIFNILLQVMDYASLTDNKGNRADFRNVVLIMTSNAGAQYAAQAKVGFGNSTTSGDAMLRQVKKIFKPEFLNRLSGTIVFNEMSRDMASRILNKKISQLKNLLATRNVTLNLSATASEHILKEGFTPEYGARELDRVIASQLKPLLMREILFGKLKKGGVATVTAKEGKLMLEKDAV